MVCFIIICYSSNNVDITDGPSSKKKFKSNDQDPIIISQNKLIFKYRDYLKTVQSSVWKELLVHNKQDIPIGNTGAVSY